MQHEAGSLYTLVGVGITALATIAVAWISARRGRKLGADEKHSFAPSESGEHAHTRDVIKAIARDLNRRFDEVGRRFDALERGRAIYREQEQIDRSARRVIDRDATYNQGKDNGDDN